MIFEFERLILAICVFADWIEKKMVDYLSFYIVYFYVWFVNNFYIKYSHAIYRFKARFLLYLTVLLVFLLSMLASLFWSGMFQFKLSRKAAETARDINKGFGIGITSERMAQWWFKKFRSGDEREKMKRVAHLRLITMN